MLVLFFVVDCFSLRRPAERTGREAFLMEPDPPYCDVIVERYEKFTGNKAERKAGNKNDLVQSTYRAKTPAYFRGPVIIPP